MAYYNNFPRDALEREQAQCLECMIYLSDRGLRLPGRDTLRAMNRKKIIDARRQDVRTYLGEMVYGVRQD